MFLIRQSLFTTWNKLLMKEQSWFSNTVFQSHNSLCTGKVLHSRHTRSLLTESYLWILNKTGLKSGLCVFVWWISIFDPMCFSLFITLNPLFVRPTIIIFIPEFSGETTTQKQFVPEQVHSYSCIISFTVKNTSGVGCVTMQQLQNIDSMFGGCIISWEYDWRGVVHIDLWLHQENTIWFIELGKTSKWLMVSSGNVSM